jgi:hypothetical protein
MLESKMTKLKLFSSLLLVILITVLGCSKGASNPVQPMDSQSDNPAVSTPQESSRVLLGMYDLTFDPGSQQINAVPVRTADMHLNVTTYLFPPNCTDCVQYQVIHYFPNAKVANVDIQVKNPTTLNAYDLRGIVYSTTSNPEPLRFADGWTSLYDVPGGNAFNINPFVAFNKRSTDRKLAGLASSTATFHFYFPGMWNVRLAFDASYPSNCAEPYEIVNFHLETNFGSVENYEANARVEIKDWQNDVSEVIISAPALTPNINGFYSLGNNIWRTDLMNENSAPEGTYKALIRATSGGQYLYQYVEIPVAFYGSINSIAQTCLWNKEYIGSDVAMIPWALADDESVYFMTDGDDWPYVNVAAKLGQSNCARQAYVDYADLWSSTPTSCIVDEDYVYGFGANYCLFQKDYMGMSRNIDTGGWAMYSSVREGDNVWVINCKFGGGYYLSRIDIKDPYNPVITDLVEIREDNVLSMVKQGKYLYVLTQDDWSPTQRSKIKVYGSDDGSLFDYYESDLEIQFESLAICGKYLYVGIYDKDTSTTPSYSFKVFDIIDPWTIEFKGDLGSGMIRDYYRTSVHVFDDYLYLHRSSGGSDQIQVYDIFNPWAPSVVKSIDISELDYVRDFVVNDHYLFIYHDYSTYSRLGVVKYTIDWVE